jgi:hypothetical protein
MVHRPLRRLAMKYQTHDREPRLTGLTRILPLAGVAYAALIIVGDLVIGEFPDADTPLAELSRYFAAHSDQVRTGGELMIWGGLALGLFGIAVWARVREAAGPTVVAGLMLVGTAVAVVSELMGAVSYVTLGSIGTNPAVTPEALQAWHVGSQFGGGGGTLLMLGLFAAGVFARVMPRWLAWAALVLGIAAVTPYGFLASMLVLLWTAVTGIVLTVRKIEPAVASHTGAGVAQPRPV